MSTPSFSDAEIVEGIQQGGPMREQWITRLYGSYLHYINKARVKYQLSDEDLQDAYADAVIALGEQVADGRFREEAKLSTYLYRIFFNKCVDIIRKYATNRVVAMPDLPDTGLTERDSLDDLAIQDQMEVLGKYLDQLGDRCKQILLYWGYWGYNMHEIAEKMGFKNNKSVISQKHKCFEKLKKMIRQDDFLDT